MSKEEKLLEDMFGKTKLPTCQLCKEQGNNLIGFNGKLYHPQCLPFKGE